MADTRVRVLPQHEWPRLATIGPFAEAGVLPDPLYATVLVEENDAGEIVGTWMITSIMLLEGLWRREDVRKLGVSPRRLLFGMVDFMRDRQIKTAITAIQDDTVKDLARKAGFVAVPGGGELFTVTLRDQE